MTEGLGSGLLINFYFKFEKVHIDFNLNISLNWHLVAQTYLCKKSVWGGYIPGGPVAKTPNTGGLGLIPGQGTRSCMPQLRLRGAK